MKIGIQTYLIEQVQIAQGAEVVTVQHWLKVDGLFSIVVKDDPDHILFNNLKISYVYHRMKHL